MLDINLLMDVKELEIEIDVTTQLKNIELSDYEIRIIIDNTRLGEGISYEVKKRSDEIILKIVFDSTNLAIKSFMIKKKRAISIIFINDSRIINIAEGNIKDTSVNRWFLQNYSNVELFTMFFILVDVGFRLYDNIFVEVVKHIHT